MSVLIRGTQGEPVRILQKKLGVDADGIFGVGTETALKEYQAGNGLAVDGIAGPDTFMNMGLYELLLLKVGTRGETVKKLQEALSLAPDGAFGGQTAAAVRKFQGEHGLEADGIAGPLTLAQVPGFEISAEQLAASTITSETVPVDPSAVQQAAQNEPPPPPEHASVVAKIEGAVAAVGKSIWNTIKKIV